MIMNGIYAPSNNFSIKGTQDVRYKVGRPISQTTTMTAASQVGAQLEIPANGDLAGLLAQLTVTATGTLTTPTKTTAAVTGISMSDKSGVAVWDGLNGTDLKYLQFWLGLRGKFQTMTDNTTAGATNTLEVPCMVDSAQLPLKLTPTIGAFSTLAASGATGGTVTLALIPIYRDGITTTTNRVRKISTGVIAGTTGLNSSLPRDRRILALGVAYTSTYLTSVTLSRDGSPEILSYDLNSIKAHEYERFTDGTQAGFVLLEPFPIDVTDKTVLDWVSTTADTISIYEFMQDFPK